MDDRAIMAAARPSVRDERDAPRFPLLIRTAKIVCDSGEYLCIVRDISASGVQLRLFHPLPAARSLTLELSNGASYPLKKVWEEPNQAGFRFAGAVDVHAFMEEPSRHARRPIRLHLRLAARLRARGGACRATVHDISRYGARIQSARIFEIDERVELELPGVPPIAASVCWRNGLQHGLVLRRTFTFEDLARLAAALQPV